MNKYFDLCDIHQSILSASKAIKENRFACHNINAYEYLNETLETAQKKLALQNETALLKEKEDKLNNIRNKIDPKHCKKQEKIKQRKDKKNVLSKEEQLKKFKEKMSGLINKTYQFDTGGKAEFFIRDVKNYFEYKEDEKFILPDETAIPDELWKYRRQWNVLEGQYDYNLVTINILARLVAISAAYKMKKKAENLNSNQTQMYEYDHKFGTDLFSSTFVDIPTTNVPQSLSTTTCFPSPYFDDEKMKIDQQWEIKMDRHLYLL